MKQLTNNSFNKQKGFTLIELVVVIVILGILAATAAPKFIDIQDDAKTATLQAVKGSMQTASALVYGKSLIKGNENTEYAAAVDESSEGAGDGDPEISVKVNGAELAISYGYPIADYVSKDAAGDATEIDTTSGGWTDLIEVDTDFQTAVVENDFYVYPKGRIAPTGTDSTDDNNCFVYYSPSTGPGVPPTVTVIDCL